jgi:uncharacterized membrane protein
MNIKARLQNKLFIMSIISFVVLMLKTFTKIELPSNFDTLVNVGLGILTGLGVIIDPTTPGITDPIDTTLK